VKDFSTIAAPINELTKKKCLLNALQDFRSNAMPKKCSKRPKNGSNCTFATIVFWLNVVALVRVAIAECNGLRFSCDTQPLYCNTFDAFATHGECCNTSNCNHYGCGNSINYNELGIASDTYCDTLVV